MALVLKDRVKETTTTSGTGSVTLAGPVQGYQGFSAIGNGNTTYYCIAGVAEWEVGIGTYSGGVLSRDTVLGSSASGAKVGFSSEVKDVFCTYAAAKAVSSDNFPMTGAISSDSPNASVNVASLTSNVSTANGDIALVPKGTGALLGDIPTSTAAGGNKRGNYAVDWQTLRVAADQVASGIAAVIGGGENNKSTNFDSTVAGGSTNQATGIASTVSGGSSNQATGNQSTVAGGSSNLATNAQATIGGGRFNAASGQYATIAGGQDITASGNYTFVGGGELNVVSATYGVVGGGFTNTSSGQYSTTSGGRQGVASGNYSTVAGGRENVASANYAFVGGGTNNTSSALYSGVLSGSTNTASSHNSTVAGGDNNVANGRFSSVIGGQYGTARGISGYVAMPASESPIEAKLGVQQAGCLVLGAETTNATKTKLKSDTFSLGSTNQLVLANNSAITVSGNVVGCVTGGGDTAGWVFTATAKRGANAASTTLIASNITEVGKDSGASFWMIDVDVDTTNGVLFVAVTGQAATTIRWVATIYSAEVTY